VRALSLVFSVVVVGCSVKESSVSTTSVSTTSVVEDAPTTTTSSLVVDTVAPDGGFSLQGIGYDDVPVLGPGPVWGTGCGSGSDGDPLLPDELPDGLWFGSLGPQYEYHEPTGPEDRGYGYARLGDSRLEIDLWCVYAGVAAKQRYNDPRCLADMSCSSGNAAWWFTEDRSNKLRSVSLAADYRYSAEPEISDPFRPGCSSSEALVANAAWRLWPVWIAVDAGVDRRRRRCGSPSTPVWIAVDAGVDRRRRRCGSPSTPVWSPRYSASAVVTPPSGDWGLPRRSHE